MNKEPRAYAHISHVRARNILRPLEHAHTRTRACARVHTHTHTHTYTHNTDRQVFHSHGLHNPTPLLKLPDHQQAIANLFGRMCCNLLLAFFQSFLAKICFSPLLSNHALEELPLHGSKEYNNEWQTGPVAQTPPKVKPVGWRTRRAALALLEVRWRSRNSDRSETELERSVCSWWYCSTESEVTGNRRKLRRREAAR